MRNYNFATTLSLYPSTANTHKMLYITRGATASIAFDFASKIYSFNNADQITFMFKQGDTISWYRMFSYIIETEDTVVDPTKTYFENIKVINGNSCQGSEVITPADNPKEAGYYELIEADCGRTTTKYIADPLFYHGSGEGFDYLTLTIPEEDTLNFKPTTPDNLIKFEVAIRLNTDSYLSLGNSDSIIIEPQHPVAVIDSLYSRIMR